METEFIYWAHKLPAGIEVEEVCGGEDRNGPLWRALALQLIAEHSPDGMRSVGHYPSGAPFLEGENRRVSLTHTGHFLAMATRPESVEPVSEGFDARNALGIDAERWDREQVRRIRERFLGPEELESIAPDDLEGLIMAWTAKEAAYKAMLTPGLDFRKQIRIVSLPGIKDRRKGVAEVTMPDGHVWRLNLCAWDSEGHCVTVAYI